MRSDHWNFLANLLGTPGPAEPPKEEKQVETPPASDAPEADLSHQDDAEASRPSDSPAASSEENVLDALKTVEPEARVPGFESSESEELIDEPTASGSSELDEAWGGLAAELGIEPEPERRPPPKPPAPSPSRPPARSQREKPQPAKKKTWGFGFGLGGGAEPEEDEPQEETDETDDLEIVDAQAEVVADEFDEVPPAAEFDRDSGSRHSAATRSERPSRRDEPSDDAPADDDQSRPPRRRGRRGARQRMSESDVDRGEPDREKPDR